MGVNFCKELRKLKDLVQTDVRGQDGDPRAAVGGAHAFVLLVARCLGLAPVSFERTKSGKPARWLLALSPTICVISCVAISIMLSLSLFGLASELLTDPSMSTRMRSMTARVVGSCDILAIVFTSATGVFGAPKRARRTLHVLRLLTSVDNSLGLELLYTQERNSCILVVIILLLWTCLMMDDFALYANQAKLNNTHLELLRNYLAFYLLYYVVLMLEVQFAYTAHAIYLRIKKLNMVLAATGRNLSLIDEKSTIVNKSSPVFKIKVQPSDPIRLGALVDALGLVSDEKKATSHEPAECIRRLSELHGTLCAAAREVDASFGLPVLIILISTLLHLIVTPYFLILEMGGAHRPHYLILQALWCLAHGFRLLLLVEPCHRTKAEAARTGDIVGEMLGHGSAGSAVLRRLEIFSRQLLHRSPDFTALGVCTLDRPLIASVSGAVTTYLVILIQFQKQDDMKDGS